MKLPPLLTTIALLTALPGQAQEPTPKQDSFFDPDVVQDIRVDIENADLARMRDALPERIYVPATFRWNDLVLTRVGIRYKGNSSSRPNQSHKRSFLLKFAEFVDKQRFLGLRRVALDNGVQFGSLFSERLITDILRDVGVRASRCNYARLTLNGEFHGVYVNVERIDKSFLKRNFKGKRGALYKVHVGGPGADLRFRGEDPKLYAGTFEQKAGGKDASLSDLVAFIKGVDRGGAEFEFEKRFDADGFLWQTGVLLLAGAFDQYTGWGPHNYYLYRDPKLDRWHYLTWDLDVGFADHAFGRVPVIDGWNAAWPVPMRGRPLLERVVTDEKLLRTYRDRARKLLATHFEPERLGRCLDRLYAQIEKDLKRDPFPKGRITVRGERSYEDTIESMKAFMVARHARASEQLANPGPRPAPAQGGRGRRGRRGEGPRPGPPSTDAPSGLEVVANSKDGVRLKWKDNANGERAFVVQRSTGADNPRFDNLMGLPGENLTGATDKRARAGRTYRYRVFAVKPTPGGAVATGASNIVTVRVKAK